MEEENVIQVSKTNKTVKKVELTKEGKIVALIILVLVVTAGVDVRNGSVVFADATGQGGKQPRFMLSELEDIQLHNQHGEIDPDKDSLIGGRIVFFTTSGEQFVYYPVQITAKQYKSVRKGLFELKSKI